MEESVKDKEKIIASMQRIQPDLQSKLDRSEEYLVNTNNVLVELDNSKKQVSILELENEKK